MTQSLGQDATVGDSRPSSDTQTGPDPINMSSQVSDNADTGEQGPLVVKKNLRFWLVVAALAVTCLLAALEITIVSTGTATVVAELGGQNSYSWMAGSYLLAL